MKKTWVDISLVLTIIITLSLSVVVADALFGGTDSNVDIGVNNPEKSLADPGDMMVSSISELQEGRFTAQDVDRLFPEDMEKDRVENVSAGYGSLTTALVDAVNELTAENEQLKQQNRVLEARVSEIESILAMLNANGNVSE